MKYIITENQYEYYKILRRLDMIWNAITYTEPYINVCNYDNEELFIDYVIGSLDDVVYGDFMTFGDEELPIVQKVARFYFSNRLKKVWKEVCGK